MLAIIATFLAALLLAAMLIELSARLPAAASGSLAGVVLVAWVAAAILGGPGGGWAARGLLVVCAGVALGHGAGRLVRTTPALVSFSIAAGIADLVSVLTGPTRWLLGSEAAGRWIPALAVTVPLEEGLAAVIGVADIAIYAGLFLGLHRAGSRRVTAHAALIGALSAALAAGLLFGRAMPAVAFMAVATLLAVSRSKGADSR